MEEYFNYLIIERCNEIYYKIISKNEDFQNLQTEIENCFEELLRLLPEPAQKEIIHEKLWGIIGTLEMLLPRLTYRQVLKDGIRLKGLILESVK